VTSGLKKRFRCRVEADSLQIDFPKRYGSAAAKRDVIAELDRIDPTWPRLFRIYPTEHAIREDRYSQGDGV
jgi:hypothetical protein